MDPIFRRFSAEKSYCWLEGDDAGWRKSRRSRQPFRNVSEAFAVGTERGHGETVRRRLEEIVGDLGARLDSVRERIHRAAVRAGRYPASIRLVAVSKTFPANSIREAARAGQRDFGENKVQEALTKMVETADLPLSWHLIGHLQSNKARKAVQLFDVIQSVDSIEPARRLERIYDEEHRDDLLVFVQVDLAGETTKSGIPESDLTGLVEYLKTCRRLKFDGLMLLPPYFDNEEDARPFFKRLRDIRDRVSPGGELSMGMSHDFEIAIEEGATVVRVGTAIFGER